MTRAVRIGNCFGIYGDPRRRRPHPSADSPDMSDGSPARLAADRRACSSLPH